MKFKKNIVLILVFLIFLIASSTKVYAFQPAAHHVIMKEVTRKLPQGSIIRESLEQYPGIATWGANAPDLGYMQVRQIFDYAPWADRFHNYKVGSFAKRQLELALQSGDRKEIAFAAGWLTHIMADYACHGIYVNPEAGFYLENTELRPLHKKLETMAEEYIWVNKGGYSKESYEKIGIYNKFDNIDNIPFILFNRASVQVYGMSPSISDVKSWATFLKIGLETGIGYNYTNYNECIQFLSQNNRIDRLERSYNQAVNSSINLLEQIEKGNTNNFSDRWNLDFGKSDSPFSNLTLTITTSKTLFSGTDDDVYFIIELQNGDKIKWYLDKKGYNDFEMGDRDEYYLPINDKRITPNSVKKFYLRKEKARLISDDWKVEKLEVNINGIDVFSRYINAWIDKNGGQFGFDVDLRCVNNLVDTPID